MPDRKLFLSWELHLFFSALRQNRFRIFLASSCVALLAGSPLAAQAPQRPPITGVSHIALYAHDFDKSRQYYGQLLGFAEPYTLKNPDGSPIMTFFKVNERQYIELSPEVKPDTDRLNHISFETTDIEGLRKYLASKGVDVPKELHPNRIGNVSFHIIDPEGHQVEMVQYMPGSWTLKAKGKDLPESRVSRRMAHVGIIVTNFDAEYKFYTEILGFKETWRGSSNGKTLSWINLKVPDGDDYVEFMLFKDAPAPTKRGTAHHLCLFVPDVPATVAAIKTKPAFASYTRPLDVHVGVNRKRIANFFDPDGTRTEVMEPVTVDGKPTPPSTAPLPR